MVYTLDMSTRFSVMEVVCTFVSLSLSLKYVDL